MNKRNIPTKQSEPGQGLQLPAHPHEGNSLNINILPLDHTNPYDFMREHRHTYYELMLIEQGGGNQLIDFNNYPVHDHSCYIIFPQQVHLMNRKKASGIVIQFTEERISSAELRTALKHYSFKENAAIVFEKRSDLATELNTLLVLLKNNTSRPENVSSILQMHLMQSLISMVLLHASNQEMIAPKEDKKLLTAFYQLLEEHFTGSKGVAEFVQLLGTNEKKLSAATKKYAGLSPLQVIHNRILIEAKRMLLFEDQSHKEIAFQLGFDSPASFSAFIKLKTGFSPSELTKHLAEIHKQ